MKYIVFVVLMIVILVILLPIMIIKWDDKGLDEVFDGLENICGID